jgi:DNA-binding transcriptional LysR family regulator
MAQPPLSQQIRRLQADLGVELFRRTSRKVELTEHGTMLLEVARRALGEAENVRKLADGLKAGTAGRPRPLTRAIRPWPCAGAVAASVT